MIDNQIIEAIQDLNKQYGRELSLDELLEIESKTGIFKGIAFKNRKEADKFMLVHVTDYTPTDNEIKTPFQTRKTLKKENLVGEVETKIFRDTVHFTVNTTVSSHENGDWSERKYAIFIPMNSFVDKNGQNIKSCQVVDFYIKGQANLPNDSYLLCPQDEVEQIKKENPNITVIGYQEKNVIEYTKKFLIMLQISTKKCGKNSYEDNDEKDFHTQHEIQEILLKKTGKNIPCTLHFYTIEREKEGTLAALSTVVSALNNIKKNKLFDRLSKEILENYLTVEQSNTQWQWKNDVDSIEELQELVNQINKLSIPLGISALQFYGNKQIQNEERIYESLKIDEFIGKDINEVFESDMLITNIKRISLILDKIDSENLYGDKNATSILTSAIKHLQEDYRITLEKVDIRKKYDDKFDLKSYQKELDKWLRKLGINHKYLEKENLTEIILKEIYIQDFIDKNISEHRKKHDLILDTITNLSDIEKIISKKYEYLVKNNTDNTFDKLKEEHNINEYLENKLVELIDEDYIINLKNEGINITEYMNILEAKLQELGITLSDFLFKEKNEDEIITKSKIVTKMERNFHKKLLYIYKNLKQTEEQEQEQATRNANIF